MRIGDPSGAGAGDPGPRGRECPRGVARLVDVGDARRLLDLAERRLVARNLLLLLLDVRLRDRVPSAAARRAALLLLRRLRRVHRLAPRPLAPLELGVDLLLLGDEGAALGEFFLSHLALLRDERLEAGELVLRQLLALRGRGGGGGG